MAISNPFIWGKSGRKMSPEQIARERELTQAALERGVDTSPVGHWSQGAARVVDALGTGLRERRANKAEEAGMAGADDYIANNPVLSALIGSGGGGITTGIPAGVATPQSEEEQLGDAAMQAIGRPPVGGGAGLPQSLVQSESGGNWNALNSEGYGGRGQFGADRLADAARAGIIPAGMTGADYSRAPESVQLAVEDWHKKDILGNLGKYVGVDIDGPGPIPPLTEDSILAVAHLGGTGGAKRFIESGGQYNPADSNGTSLSDYARRHAGGAPMGGSFAGGNTQVADNSNVVAALTGAMSDPWVAKKYGPVIQAMLGQQMKQQDPAYQLGLQKAQLEIDAMRNPAAPEPITVGGVLVDPTTYEPLFDSRTDKDPTSVGEYKFYADQAVAAGRDPMPYEQWDLARKQAGASSTNVNVGDGSPGLGKLSSDYGYVLDPQTGQPVIDPQTGLPTAAPVPGSPAAREIEQAGRKAEGAKAQKARAGSTVVQDLQRGLDLIPELGMLGSEGGVIGGISRTTSAKIPGTVANRITQFTESALSNVGLDTLQNMRENSPTGGALGQVPIQQQQRLEQVLGSLNINQPPEVLEANIKRVMNIYNDIIYGDADERARAVAEGRMSPEQSAEIDGYYYELPFDERGMPIEQDADGWTEINGVKIRVKQ